jgi:hypothetical protein
MRHCDDGYLTAVSGPVDLADAVAPIIDADPITDFRFVAHDEPFRVAYQSALSQPQKLCGSKTEALVTQNV